MQLGLNYNNKSRYISPFRELGAYEALWDQNDFTFKSLAEKFNKSRGAIPSDFVEKSVADKYADIVYNRLKTYEVGSFGVRVHGAAEYPNKLRDAVHPVELIYYQGWWDLVYSRCISVVGTRNPSEKGKVRTRNLVKDLIEDDFTIVSGLAAGIDSEAHRAAIKAGGRTIAVIGTPIGHYYPKLNVDLQKMIAKEYLVISQVPLCRYENQDYRINRLFFPERNKTMSALTLATFIVEAGETSGTLVQARAALQQRRKLFILDSCFKNRNLSWPQRFEQKGAIRVKNYEDIRSILSL